MAHGDLPDINKEMFKYLLERIHVVEVALKEEDGIDVSEKIKNLNLNIIILLRLWTQSKRTNWCLELGFGLITGFVSGFFGVGGGMILVPMLLIVGYDEKLLLYQLCKWFFHQFMVLFKYKNATCFKKDGLIIGIGGFVGWFTKWIYCSNVSNEFLQYLLSYTCFAIVRIFILLLNNRLMKEKSKKIYTLFILDFYWNIAMSIGVGGSILLTPF